MRPTWKSHSVGQLDPSEPKISSKCRWLAASKTSRLQLAAAVSPEPVFFSVTCQLPQIAPCKWQDPFGPTAAVFGQLNLWALFSLVLFCCLVTRWPSVVYRNVDIGLAPRSPHRIARSHIHLAGLGRSDQSLQKYMPIKCDSSLQVLHWNTCNQLSYHAILFFFSGNWWKSGRLRQGRPRRQANSSRRRCLGFVRFQLLR